MRRLLAIVALVVLWGPAPASAVVPAESEWWEQEGPVTPGDLAAGWNFRVFVRAENPHGASIRDLVVHAEIDFADVAVQSGWPSTRSGDRLLPRSFTLDPDSIRVVRYDTDFRRPVGDPVPALFQEGWWWTKTRSEPFHAGTNPIGTVTWIGDGTWGAREARRYVVHFDVLENAGGKPPQSIPADAAVELGAVHGTGRGQVFVAYAGNANVNEFLITALHATTRVTVLESRNGFTTPYRDPGGAPNEFTISAAGATARFVVRGERHYRLVTDKPALVLLQGRPGATDQGAGGYWLPAETHSFLGHAFVTGDGPATEYWVYNPNPFAEAPAVTLRDRNGATNVVNGWGGGDVLSVPSAARIEVPPTGPPVLVQAAPTTFDPLIPMPSSDGAGAGQRLMGGVLQNGVLVLGSAAGDVSVVGNELQGFQRILPPESALYQVASGPENALRTSLTSRIPARSAVELVPSPREAPAALFAYTGPANAVLGAPVPPVGRNQFLVPANLGGPVDVYAVFPSTAVRIEDLTTGETSDLGLAADQHVSLSQASAWRVTSDKPISLEPRVAASRYARFASAFDPGALVEIEGAQRRGYALRLTAVQPAGDPAAMTVLPGRPTTATLRLDNVAQWTGGQGLPDEADMRILGIPVGWSATLASSRIALGPLESRLVELQIAAPDHAPAGSSATLTVLATSQGNPNMQDRATFSVFVRRVQGVDLWFGRDSNAGPDTATQNIEPGGVATYDFRIRNTGGERDTFRIETSSPHSGWSVEVRDGAARSVTSLTLASDESRALVLRVDVSAEPATARIVTSITAVSTNDAVSDKILATTQIPPTRDVRLVADTLSRSGAPGALVEFNVTIENRAPQPLTARLGLDWTPPLGWSNASFPEEVSLFPGEPFRFPLRIRVGPGANASYFAALRLHVASVESGGVQRPLLDLHLVVHADAVHRLDVEWPSRIDLSLALRANATVKVTNRGNDLARVSVRALDLPPGVDLTPSVATRVEQGASKVIDLELVAGPFAAPAAYHATLALVVEDGPSLEETLDVTVPAYHIVDLVPVRSPLEAEPGQVRDLEFRLKNRGNVEGVFRVRVTAAPIGLDLPLGEWSLAPNETRALRATITAPATQGDHTLRVEAASILFPTAAKTLDVPLLVGSPDVRVETVSRTDGQFRVVLRNVGVRAASDLIVQLVASDRVHDQLTVGRLPAGEARTVILHAVPGAPLDDVQVVLPGASDQGGEARSFDVPVHDGSGKPASSPSLLAALLIASGIVLVRRRRCDP